MSEYTVKKHYLSDNQRGAYTHLLEGNDLTKFVDTDIFNVVSDLNQEITTLRKENYALRIERETLQYDDKLADEILERMGQENEELKTELATAQAALVAQSEALAVARQAITQAHDLLEACMRGYGNYKQVNGAWNILNQQVASWGGAANATADVPQQAVTLTDTEIDWLRQWDYTDKEGLYAFSVPSGKMNVHIVDKMALEIRLYDLPMHNWWRLDSLHDTPANRAAIEARRKKSE